MRGFYCDITQIPALNSILAHLYSMMPVAFDEMALKGWGLEQLNSILYLFILFHEVSQYG